MKCFEDQSFIVTGAASPSGIGIHFVKELLRLGVKKIAIFDIAPSDALNELKSQYSSRLITFHKVDVRRKADVESAFQEVINKFGYVDVLANIAGIADETKIEDTVYINLYGVMYTTFAAINHMSVRNGGHGGTVVNVASVAAIYPFNRSPVYCGTKGAVLAFTRSLSDETLNGELGMKFVVVCPGYTHTGLVRAPNLYGTVNPDEITSLMLSRFGTGQTSEECGKSMVRAIKQSENGTVWILDKADIKSVDSSVLSRAYSK